MNYTRKKWIDEIKDQNNQIIQQGTPMSAGNFNNLEVGVSNANLDVDNANNAIRDAIPSGLVKLSTIDPTYSKTNPNKIKLTGGATAYVNGFKVDIADGTIIDVGVPPATGEREDLVFLEVWKDQYTDTQGEKINSRIRVVQGVDFNTYVNDGFTTNVNAISSWLYNNQNVLAQGGNASVPPLHTTSRFTNNMQRRDNTASSVGKFAYDDPGLYVAGTGDQSSKDLLKAADGYSYAIPLFRVRRRNSGGYSVVNPNGAREYYQVPITSGGTRTYNDVFTLTGTTGLDKAKVGDVLVYGGTHKFEIIALLTSTSVTVRYTNNIGPGTIGSFNNAWVFTLFTPVGIRPDTLLADIIEDRDILDLRHQVSLTGFNYQALLEENFDKLLRGELQTKERKKMLKVYHGIPKTPVDGNTVFYASLDSTTVAEVGGALSFVNYVGAVSPIGGGIRSISTPTTKEVAGISNAEGTLDFWFNYKDAAFISSRDSMLQLLNVNGYRALNIQYDHSSSIPYFHVEFIGTEGSVPTVARNFVNIANCDMRKGDIHVRVTWSLTSGKTALYMNGKKVAETTYTSPMLAPTKLLIGAGVYTATTRAYEYRGSLADISISNIDRGAVFATLPADFIAGYARIDKAMNGQRKTHSDALASQYTVGIAKGDGSTPSKGLTVTKAGANWASGDTIKVKGLASSIISGVVDSDTTLATLTKNSIGAGPTGIQLYLNDVSKLAVNDTFRIYDPITNTLSSKVGTVTAVDSANNMVTVSVDVAGTDGMWLASYILTETTAITSVPILKFMNAGTLTNVVGTWVGLGTIEATFTLGTNASLVNADIQIEYSLNMTAGQGGIPEVYTATLAGEYKGKKLIPGTVAVRDDLKNKVIGDGNPITVKYIKNAAVQLPAAFTTEVTNSDYTNMGTQGDGLTYNLTTSVNGEIPQALIAVDIVKEVEAKYGPIPSVDKAGWVKVNVSKLTITPVALGVHPTGNKLLSVVYRATDGVNSDIWTNYPNAALASIGIEINAVNIANYIDNNGITQACIYTDASNGTIASSITVDSISVAIELKNPVGYDMLVPENPRRDGGLAGILLVRKETKEIQTYFDCSNTDGVVTYGDYVPYQGIYSTLSNNTSGAMLTEPAGFYTTDGTGTTKARNTLLNIAQFPIPFTTMLPQGKTVLDCEFTQARIDLVTNATNVIAILYKFKDFAQRDSITLAYKAPYVGSSVGVSVAGSSYCASRGGGVGTNYFLLAAARIPALKTGVLMGVYTLFKNGNEIDLLVATSTSNETYLDNGKTHMAIDIFRLTNKPLIK